MSNNNNGLITTAKIHQDDWFFIFFIRIFKCLSEQMQTSKLYTKKYSFFILKADRRGLHFSEEHLADVT